MGRMKDLAISLENWRRVIDDVLSCLSDPKPLEHQDCIRDLEQLVAEMKAYYGQEED